MSVELKIPKRPFIQEDRKSWGLEYKLLGQIHAEHQKKLRQESQIGMAIRSWEGEIFRPLPDQNFGPPLLL